MKTLEKIYTGLSVVATLAIITVSGVYLNNQYDVAPTLGSVTVGNEYQATGTPSGVGVLADLLIAEGQGSLGSVIVTKAGDVDFTLYDATSTGSLTTDPAISAESQQLGRISTNLAAGTYTFDVGFTRGLFLDVTQGTNGTSTVTFRR